MEPPCNPLSQMVHLLARRGIYDMTYLICVNDGKHGTSHVIVILFGKNSFKEEISALLTFVCPLVSINE